MGMDVTSSKLPDGHQSMIMASLWAEPARLSVAGRNGGCRAASAGSGWLHPGGRIYHRAASHNPSTQGQVLGKGYWQGNG